MTDDVLKPDLCVVGGGPAGLAVALMGAALGASIVLVERDRMGGSRVALGGLSEALAASAAAAEAFRKASPFGVAAAKPRVDWSRVRAHGEDVAGALALDGSPARLRALGVRVIDGEARFVGPLTMLVGDHAIQARRFVLATGAQAAAPDVPGLAQTPFWTPEDAVRAPARPERLVILGGEPAAAELAQAFRRLGSEVVLVVQGAMLPGFDPEAEAALAAALRREGVDVRDHLAIRAIAPEPGGVRVETDSGEILAGSHLLVAAGRRARTQDLLLDKAGIGCDVAGVLVDAGLRTSNKRVFAIGDCLGGAHGAWRGWHPSELQASVVIRRALFRAPARYDAKASPRVVRTEPEIASVGLDEAAAGAGRKIRLLRWPYADSDAARARRLTEGAIKVITDRSGVVLGASIAGARAAELIGPWTLAVKKGLAVADLRDLAAPPGSFATISQRAALSFEAGRAASPLLRRLLSTLRLFG